MPPVDLTVAIVSYNVRPFLDHCLQSVFRAARDLRVQVIVVDNASRDGSAQMTARRHAQALLIENRENLGFARANNQAFGAAQGEAVLILNPDSFIPETTLRLLLTRLASSRDIGAVGPMILLPDGRFEPRSMRGFPTPWTALCYLSGLSRLFPRNPYFSRYLLSYLDPTQEHEVEALSGCCMMVRRDLLDKLGGFDADYFMYGEDLDLCWRIHKAGFRILYTPSTSIVHFKGESTRWSEVDSDHYQQQAMKLFVDKNLAGSLSWPVRSVMALGFRLHAVDVLRHRQADRSALNMEAGGSREGLIEFNDMEDLERQIVSGNLHQALISTGDGSYDKIIALIRNLHRQVVDFTLHPLDGEGDKASKLRLEVKSRTYPAHR